MSHTKGATKKMSCLSGASETCIGIFLTTSEKRICHGCTEYLKKHYEVKIVVDRKDHNLVNFWSRLK